MIELALLRRPCATFARGISEANLGAPDLTKALQQHEVYAQALRDQDIEVLILEPDNRFPDSCFVEDCAVIAGETLIWTRPGAESRRAEVDLLREQLDLDFDSLTVETGTVDGGDVCQLDDRFLIGLSARTDEAGAACLAGHLESLGFSSELIDIRGTPLLHLKSGVSYLGDGTVIVAEALREHEAWVGMMQIIPSAEEAYAANAVCIGKRVILSPAGFSVVVSEIRGLEFEVIELEMSEFQKMDGGISCLSLRFG